MRDKIRSIRIAEWQWRQLSYLSEKYGVNIAQLIDKDEVVAILNKSTQKSNHVESAGVKNRRTTMPKELKTIAILWHVIAGTLIVTLGNDYPGWSILIATCVIIVHIHSRKV